jgi:cortical fragment-lytic enzyme
MIGDFLKKVPREKITVIFGMFGYDWKVGEKGQSISPATSLTLNEIQKQFLSSCHFTNCQMVHDNQSSEPQITYTDDQNTKHVIWFEDIHSVEKKKIFLKTKGIFSTGMWAYSYF